jgi:hypothetical protein
MSKSSVPDPEERAFAEMVREGARELRDQRGNCPGSAELVAFFENRLEPEDAARLRTHVEACGLCDVALGRLESIGQTQASSHWKTAVGFFRSPVVAYALVLILLFPAYRGITSFENPSHISHLALLPIPVQRYTLDTVRGVQPAPTVKLPPGREVFVLSFLVPARPKFQYSAEIVNAAGAPVGPASELIAEDDLGHCSLICPRQLFRTGMYTLTVTERTPQGNRTDRQFAFQFAVEE